MRLPAVPSRRQVGQPLLVKQALGYIVSGMLRIHLGLKAKANPYPTLLKLGSANFLTPFSRCAPKVETLTEPTQSLKKSHSGAGLLLEAPSKKLKRPGQFSLGPGEHRAFPGPFEHPIDFLRALQMKNPQTNPC